MALEDLHSIVVLTGRFAAMLFVTALAGRGLGWYATRLWRFYLAAQTVHFLAVIRFARMNQGANLFPGGYGLQDVGGWPTLFGALAVFYLLATAPLVARDRIGHRWRRIGVTAIGLFYLATYIPLIARSPLFIFPTAIMLAVILFFLMRESRSATEKAR